MIDPSPHVLAASGFLLVQLGRSDFAPQTGMDLPILPDVLGPEAADRDGYSTVVALRPTNATAADGACDFIDAVDLFATLGMPCSEGGGYYGGPSPTEAIERADLCADTENNSLDFTTVAVAGPGAAPIHGSATAAHSCPACP